MEQPTTIDQAKTEAFVGKVLGDTAGLFVTVMAGLGDRLGLFKDLAASGPATSADLAARTGLDERYVREWASGMAAAGYLRYDPASRRFTLPPEHTPVLAQEGGPMFFGGVHEETLGCLRPLEQVEQAFRNGGGVPQTAFPDMTYHGMDRFTASWFENLMLQVWIPAVPDVRARLETGIDVADVGCGRGRAVIKLAQAFPRSRFVGYDLFPPNVERATARAREAGVGDRVRILQADASKGLPGTYDLITTFDVVHDAVDPLALLRTILEALKPGGAYLCLDINCSERLEENVGPLAALFYGVSVLYCMTTSLAHGGAGLGTAGLPPAKLQSLGTEAGFASIRKLPLDNPFNNLYELRP